MFQILGKESLIKFELKSLNFETFEIDKKIRGVLNVNINNISKNISFVGIVGKTGDKYRFKVEQHIKLSDFNIYPNRFLLDVKSKLPLHAKAMGWALNLNKREQ